MVNYYDIVLILGEGIVAQSSCECTKEELPEFLDSTVKDLSYRRVLVFRNDVCVYQKQGEN